MGMFFIEEQHEMQYFNKFLEKMIACCNVGLTSQWCAFSMNYAVSSRMHFLWEEYQVIFFIILCSTCVLKIAGTPSSYCYHATWYDKFQNIKALFTHGGFSYHYSMIDLWFNNHVAWLLTSFSFAFEVQEVLACNSFSHNAGFSSYSEEQCI